MSVNHPSVNLILTRGARLTILFLASTTQNDRILRKTDLVILSIICWVYFLQILDKSVVGYAAVFGLEEDTVSLPSRLLVCALTTKTIQTKPGNDRRPILLPRLNRLHRPTPLAALLRLPHSDPPPAHPRPDPRPRLGRRPHRHVRRAYVQELVSH